MKNCECRSTAAASLLRDKARHGAAVCVMAGAGGGGGGGVRCPRGSKEKWAGVGTAPVEALLPPWCVLRNSLKPPSAG
jgi:hypothetical protein